MNSFSILHLAAKAAALGFAALVVLSAAIPVLSVGARIVA
jgi:hypothetical protein